MAELDGGIRGLPKVFNLAASICRIKLEFSGGSIADATGFVYKLGREYWLITAWHVVSGRHAETKELMIAGEYPIYMSYRTAVTSGSHIKLMTIRQTTYTDKNRPSWLVHPVYCDDVDVVAIPFPDNIVEYLDRVRATSGTGASVAAVNDPKFHRNDIDFRVMDSLFIGGYPRALQQENDFPIWKHAMIASEPAYDYFGLPRILIDGATRQGLSGGPALVTSKYGRYLTASGGIVDGANSVSRLVGVYSSRVPRREQEAEFGYVWKASVIESIISGLQFDVACQKAEYVRRT